MAIRRGLTYRSNAPVPYGPARIRITGYLPGDAVASAVDPDTGVECVVRVEDLHAKRPAGDNCRDGYTLTND